MGEAIRAMRMDAGWYAALLDSSVLFLVRWAAKHTSGAARQATRAAVAMVMGCEPGQISVLYFCWYIAAAGSIEQVCNG
jgi:hypothetical protein